MSLTVQSISHPPTNLPLIRTAQLAIVPQQQLEAEAAMGRFGNIEVRAEYNRRGGQ
jgi:hypothetical protein